jgi:hypothetical protein
MVLSNKKRNRMKATLEFKLPEEQSEFNRANQSLQMALALWHISNLNHDFRIVEILEKYNLNVEELIQ